MKGQRSNNTKRQIDGILLLDKPTGITSNAALQRVKRHYNASKAGHTGSLDPLASGMLPICFGEATKFSQYLLEADKTYLVEAKLGVRTTTSDAEGEVVSEKPVANYTLADLDQAFAKFRGEIEQVPSMFSAIKHQGQPLYKIARQGIVVERESRKLTVHRLDVLSYRDEIVKFELKCSKGTYVRTIVDDFGEHLGCGAHVISLRRLNVGPYEVSGMVTLETLEQQSQFDQLDQYLLPTDTSIKEWPELSIAPNLAFYLQQGQSVFIPNAPANGWVRLVMKDGTFIGVGEIESGGKVAPRRLVKTTNR